MSCSAGIQSNSEPARMAHTVSTPGANSILLELGARGKELGAIRSEASQSASLALHHQRP